MTDSVRVYLRKPTFDNWQWDDAEILVLLQQMYIDLGFLSTFNIEVSQMEYGRPGHRQGGRGMRTTHFWGKSLKLTVNPLHSKKIFDMTVKIRYF
jgi:hypothetical protein